MQLFSRLSTKAILTNIHMTKESLGFFLFVLLTLRKTLGGGGDGNGRGQDRQSLSLHHRQLSN